MRSELLVQSAELLEVVSSSGRWPSMLGYGLHLKLTLVV